MTKLVGILNLTPDSFSGDGVDGGDALTRIDAMIAQGAAVIDVGAESTRPGATLLTFAEEWQRLSPLVRNLGKRVDTAAFSIDTRHAETAAKALEAEFTWVNDVSGARGNAMREVVKKYNAMLVVMHSLSIPADPKHTLAADSDPVAEVLAWAKAAISELSKQGIQKNKIIFDPGIGFGKTPEQSVALIKNIAAFKALGVSLLVGHSRKSFLSLFTHKPASDRDSETLVVSKFMAEQGVDYLRVHDVAGHASMLKERSAS